MTAPTMYRRLRVTSAAVLALAAGGACAKKDAATDAGVKVSNVQMGRTIDADRRITGGTTDFKPTETIYLSVVTTGSAPSATIGARWTYEDGQVVDSSSQTIAPNGGAATEFHVSKPSGWPRGKYKVEVSLNGAPVESKEFRISD